MENTSLDIGRHIFYRGVGICEIVNKTTVDDRLYFVLSTLDGRSDTTLYVPSDCKDQMDKICQIASKEQLQTAINDAKEIDYNWNDNRRERQEKFSAILRSDDFTNMLRMIRCLCLRNTLLKNENKRLSTCDNDILLKAKFIINQLLCYTHSISVSEAEAILGYYFES